MPFRDSNIKTLLLDQRAPLHIPSAVRGTISQSLLDFVNRVLTFNPAKRANLAELRELPWWNGAEVRAQPPAPANGPETN